MNMFRHKSTSILIAVLGFVSLVALPRFAQAQGFYDFVPAIPQQDPNGVPLPNANTTFADGTVFRPAGDIARTAKWAWRPYGNGGILNSLGVESSTPPNETKELVTTIPNLEPGAQYAVKVLFWSPSANSWGIRAGVVYANGSRSNTWFDNQSTNVIAATLIPWETMPWIYSEGGRTLYAADAGIATANGNGDVKVFVHDYPTGDSNRRTWYDGVAVSKVTASAGQVVNLNSAGTPFNRGVRGLALADVAINRGEYHVGIPRSLEVARGSAIRGVATGLAADLYDWRTRNGNQPRPPTLQFLRYSRDFQAELWLGANIRGLVEADPNGGYLYYDTNTTTLAVMAAEWVRYVNHIVPNYRQGDPVTDPRDLAILNSLTWSSAYPGDTFDKLLAPGEPAVPLIQYWEIGNEPTIGVGAFSVNNSYTLTPTNFHVRYEAVAVAIKDEDPNVKVGPTLVHAGREAAHLQSIAADHSLPIDFITYHPYEKMGLLNDPAEITQHLVSIHSRQKQYYNEIKRVLTENGRDADAIEYATTEVNVSNWDTNDSDKEARMAHALGTVETVFSHARLGLSASHYWIWPTHRWDGTEYPVFKAYEKLRDHMGDTLVSTYAHRNVRVYITRESRTGELAIWLLNFSNDDATTVQLNLNELPNVEHATLFRLADKSGTTSLLSLNSSSEMPGGRAINVDWSSSNMTGQVSSNLQLSLPAATLSLLVIKPSLDRLTPALIEQGETKTFSVTFKPVPYASNVRYQLLASDNLSTWEVVEEVGPGTSGTISMSDVQPVNNTAPRFFRVRVVPPM